MDMSKVLDSKSSVEIRLFDHNSDKVIYKRLTIREVRDILKIIGKDFSEEVSE